jgi:hypothetical protein
MHAATATVAPAKRFAPNHPWDRNFYLLMVALAWLGIIRGFGAEIVDHVQKHKAAFALVVHVHAIVFVTWLVLFTVQVLLIRSQKLGLHKRLGFMLVYLAALMMFLGPATALTVQHNGMANPNADPAFLSVQFTDILAFVGLTGAAIYLRRSPTSHKRLILLGTLYITDAGYARWLADPLLNALGGVTFWHLWIALYFGPLVMAALAGLYDLATRRTLHPAYVAGVAYMFSVQMLAISLYFNPAWLGISKQIIAAWPW